MLSTRQRKGGGDDEIRSSAGARLRICYVVEGVFISELILILRNDFKPHSVPNSSLPVTLSSKRAIQEFRIPVFESHLYDENFFPEMADFFQDNTLPKAKSPPLIT